MRVVITLDDTPTGIRVNAVHLISGVQDHPPDSLSVLVAAGMLAYVRDSWKKSGIPLQLTFHG